MDNRLKILQESIDKDPFLKGLGLTGGTCLCKWVDVLSERPKPPPRELPKLSDEWKEIFANIGDMELESSSSEEN
jgi:hypothetical protein